MSRIIIVDDDADCLSVLEAMVKMHGHEVIAMLDASEVIPQIMEHKPDVVITDIMMPGITGGSVYRMIRAHIGDNMPVIVCSGTTMRVSGKEDPFLVHVSKPVNQETLLKIIDGLCRKAAKAE